MERLERYDLRPVSPAAIESHARAGEVLVTLDIPGHLMRSLVVESGTGIALYRLVQLFGTPNVHGLEAGAEQPDRERTTWQYLFEVVEEGPDGEAGEPVLVSIYDHKTDVSVGISEWQEPADPPERVALEPTGDVTRLEQELDDDHLVDYVELVLNIVEEPVPATYKDLWV